MAATTATALKALIEGAGLGLSAYRDRPADDTNLPYVTIAEELALVPDGEDGVLDPDVDHIATETVQVDLWQRYLNDAGAVVESFTLPKQLRRALQGASLEDHPTRCWTVLVTNSIRFLERGPNIVHHAMTVEVVQNL